MSCLFDEVVKEGEANVPLLVIDVRNYLVFSIAWYFLSYWPWEGTILLVSVRLLPEGREGLG